MRIASILLFGTTLFSSLVNADTSSTSSTSSLSTKDEPSQVLVLTDDNFDATLTSQSLLMVKFYTPWCGYCKALAPEYESASISLGDLTDEVTMAEVDCSVHEELCIDHDIGSFPTIKLFRQGIPTLYDGPREAHAIARYLLRQTLPVVTHLEQGDQDALETLRQSDSIVVVGSGSTHGDNVAYTSFKTLADEWRDRYLFGWVATTTKPINETEDDVNSNDGGNTLVLYTRFDDQDDNVDVYTGDVHAIDSIKMFLRYHATPLFGPIGPDTYLDYEEAALPLAYLFIDSTSMLASFHDAMTALARHHRGVINFVYIDADAYPEQADYLGINTTIPDDGASLWPAFVIQDPDYNRYVLPQQMVDADTIQTHVDRFLAHSLTPFLLSDPIPESPNDGPVQVVVGSQFHDLVARSDQDVLLKVYAPWCGHCKALAPIWQKLGELVQQQSYPLRVASLDGTSNDMPVNDPATFDVDAFPTIAFIEAHTHRVALYSADNDRSLTGLVKFLHEQKAMSATKDNSVTLQLSDNDIKSKETSNQQQEGDDMDQDDQDDETTAGNSVDDNDVGGGDDQIRFSQVHDEL